MTQGIWQFNRIAYGYLCGWQCGETGNDVKNGKHLAVAEAEQNKGKKKEKDKKRKEKKHKNFLLQQV